MDGIQSAEGVRPEALRGPFSDNPRLPSDGGLSSLGLVMQLGAAVLFCMNLTLVIVALTPIIPGGSRGVMFLAALLGVVRSVIHYAVGSRLSDSAFDGRARARTYVYFSVAQSIVMVVILAAVSPIFSGVVGIYVALILLSWPAVVLWTISRPQVRELYRRAATGELGLAAKNRGIEGAGALMTAMGIVGLILGALFAFMLIKGSRGNMGFAGILMVVLVLTLLVRSGFHAAAGVGALRGLNPLGFNNQVKRYVAASVASVVLLGVLALVIMIRARTPLLLLQFLVICGLLAAWPFIINGFSKRVGGGLYFLDDDEASGFGPAPDSGLTAIGYVLLGSGAFSVAGAIGILLVGGNPFANMLGGGIGSQGATSAWYLAGPVGVLTLWAGLELVRMSDRFKVAALVYAVVAGGVAIWSVIEEVDALGGLSRMNAANMFTYVTLVSGIAVALVLPVLTVILAYRHRDPALSLKEIFS